jgi:hypothetical protein
MSVIETQHKTFGNTISGAWGVGVGGRGTNWPTEVVEIAIFFEFDENDRFFTASCDPDMSHTLRFFFTHFTIKMTQRMAFMKNA